MKSDPLTLALDTSHRTGSVAVSRGASCLAEIVFDASDTHSATLLPAVDACLGTARASLDGIDRFAVSSGPGSFTGLRIGLATVKAFASVNRRPVVAISSLEVLAAAIPFCRHSVMPLIDARRGEVYGALYDTGGGPPAELICPFSSDPVRAVKRAVEAAGAPLVLCGTGAERYRGLLEPALPRGSTVAGSPWSIPSATLLALLSLEKAPIAFEDLPSLEPLYRRRERAKVDDGDRLRSTRHG
jgi:tRNA threonylcarbamoyladenosine biosynthesis protein TsaB